MNAFQGKLARGNQKLYRSRRFDQFAENVKRGGSVNLSVSVEKMIQHIGTNFLGISYYVSDFANELPFAFPWGVAMFDCQIFPPMSKKSLTMASLISSLPYEQIDWVHTFEPDSEYWHDEVDRASVRRGVQKNVGDGKPMTVWFDDLHSPCDWEISYNFGVCSYFLFLFVESDSSLTERADLLRNKIHIR